MKKLTLILALLIPFIVFGQKKASVKVVSKPMTKAVLITAPAPPELSVEDKVKIDAETWFKTFFVTLNFKDPYSYKHAGTTLINKSINDMYTDSLRKTNTDLIMNDTTGFTFGLYKKHMLQYQKDKLDMEKKLSKTKKAEDIESLKKSIATMQQLYDDAEKRNQTERIKFQSAKDKQDLYKNKLATMSEDEKKAFFCYGVYLDCHAKNSYGGEVLGRYYFSFKDGKAISEPLKLN